MLGERIKKVRKALGLTQQKFADRLGMKQNTVATYEMGRTNPSDPAIKSICREFHISEEWLRTGQGEMFLPAANNALDKLAEEFHLDEQGKEIISEFVQLEERDRKGVIEFAKHLAQNKTLQGEQPPKTLTLEEQADQFAARAANIAREQFLAEKRQESPVSYAKESAGV